MFKLNVTGDFATKMAARIEAWRGQGKKIAAGIHAPDELSWWAFQEYGTASRGEAGGVPYTIDPVNAEALAFPGPNGTTIVRKQVIHPGIPPRHSVGKVIPDIEEASAEKIAAALNGGALDDPTLLVAAVTDAVTDAKAKIVESMAQNIPGTRVDGKLLGRTASSVFDELAEVVKVE